MKKTKDTITKFLRSNLMRTQPEGEEIRSIGIYQLAGSSAVSLDSLLIDEDADITSEWIEEKAESILELVQDDANGHSGPTSYFLHTLIGRDKRPGNKSPNFRLRPADGIGGLVLGETENPSNATGLLAQAYRHQEATQRCLIATAEATIGVLSRTVDRQAEQLQHLQQTHFDIIKERENLLSESAERQLAAKREEANQERISEVARIVTPLLPAVINRLLAGKNKAQLLPEKEKPLLVTLKKTIEKIPMEKMTQVMQVLGEDVAIPLFEVLTQIDESIRAEEKDNSNGSVQSAAH